MSGEDGKTGFLDENDTAVWSQKKTRNSGLDISATKTTGFSTSMMSWYGYFGTQCVIRRQSIQCNICCREESEIVGVLGRRAVFLFKINKDIPIQKKLQS